MSTPNQIQGGRWDEFLRSKFNLKGGPIAPEIAPEIIPTVPIPFQIEDHFLLRERLMWSRWNPAAVAGQFARAHLTNPLNSGHLIAVEGFFFSGIGTDSMISLVGGVLLTDPASFARVRDGRWARPSANAPGVGISQQGNNASRQAFDQLFIPAAFSGFLSFPVVLSPINPDMLLLEGLTVNTAVQANIFWREIVLEPSARA